MPAMGWDDVVGLPASAALAKLPLSRSLPREPPLVVELPLLGGMAIRRHAHWLEREATHI